LVPTPFEAVAGGVRVALRVTPRAAQERVQGVVADGAGQMRLKLAVRAVPEDGKANAAVVRLLAKEWDLPRTSIEVVAGQRDRSKLLHVAGESAALMARLSDWLQRSFSSAG
jgi:uncharacterized protein YggU (UPF0235/DUF167 family)